MCAMFEWFSAASVCASRVKRATRRGSFANASGRTLSATSRLSFVSCARYTSPMPPAPSTPTTSYTPRRVPGVRGKVGHRLYRPGEGGPHAPHTSQLRKSSSAASHPSVASVRYASRSQEVSYGDDNGPAHEGCEAPAPGARDG